MGHICHDTSGNPGELPSVPRFHCGGIQQRKEGEFGLARYGA